MFLILEFKLHILTLINTKNTWSLLFNAMQNEALNMLSRTEAGTLILDCQTLMVTVQKVSQKCSHVIPPDMD